MEYQNTRTTFPTLVDRAISNEEFIQRFFHITGLVEKVSPTEIKMANWVSTLILDKTFCAERDDVGISNYLHEIMIEVEGKEKLKEPSVSYTTTANRLIAKLLPGVKEYLIGLYNSQYLVDKFFHPAAVTTNLRLTGIWYIFATEELEKYYDSVKYSPYMHTGQFLELTEEFYKNLKKEG
jgi:hypothetical protein